MAPLERPWRLTEPVPDLRSLELLLLAREFGSVSRAASAVGISQPSASARLRALESSLGLRLLHRSTAGVVATSDGETICELGAVVLAGVVNLTRTAASAKRQSRVTLRLAASYTIAEHLLPSWLAQFSETHRNVSVELDVANSHEVLNRLQSRQCDLGFIEGPTAPRGVRVAPVATDRLVVVVAPDHPWARRRRPLQPQDLARTRLVTRERGSGTRDALDRALAAAGFPRMDPALELGSTSAVKAAVVAGSGPAVLSSLAAEEDVRSGRLREVAVRELDLERSLRVAWLEVEPGSPADELLSLLTESGAAPARR